MAKTVSQTGANEGRCNAVAMFVAASFNPVSLIKTINLFRVQ
jgi:hypothetical protein